MRSTRKRRAGVRLLVPLTLGGATPSKMAAVAAQARGLEARVTLLHVLEGAAPSADESPLAMEEAAVAFLDDVTAELRRDGVDVKPRVRYGSIAGTINDVAREQDAAMIIVGASEPNGWQRLLPATRAGLVGAISRDAPCPVLVVPRVPPDVELPAAA